MPDSCLIALPVYNEVECIRQVCTEWLQLAADHGDCRVLVVNDGSNDGTAEVLRELARTNPLLTVIDRPNGGHGTALLAAYRSALGSGHQWIFQVDSDRQFSAADFPLLWAERARSRFILGWRRWRQDSRLRIVLSNLHRWLLVTLFGASARDPNIPYRLMRVSLLREMLPALPDQCFAPNVLLSVLACRVGEDTRDIPIQHLARRTGIVSIRGWKTAKIAVRCLLELVRFRFRGFARFPRAVTAPDLLR